MSKTVNVLPRPEYWIKEYIFQEMKKYDPPESMGLPTNLPSNEWRPFYPPSVFSTQDFWEDYPAEIAISYDKLLRFRTSPFYRIKKEQMLLNVITAESGSEYDIGWNFMAMVVELLDREDQSAQDLNKWVAENYGFDEEVSHNVFFHKIRVYKIDESRDLLELASVNLGDFLGKVIIEYDYHVSDKPNYASGPNPEYDEDYK
jgi:hypothetical protein